MRRCRTAAATDKLRARLYESLGKLRHVLRRAHVKLAALHVARQSGVGLCRQLLLGDLAHLLERGENDRWSNTAVQPNHVRAPLVETFREQLRRRAKHRVAVSHDGHLRDDWQITDFAYGADGLAHLGNVRESFETEEFDAAFKQADSLRFEHFARFVKRGWTIRLDA